MVNKFLILILGLTHKNMDHKVRCENCIVRQLNALKTLSKEEIKCISDHKIVKSVKKGELIFEEGERLNGVFCVRKGFSKITKASENGKDQIVKIANQGEVLGQRSVVTEERTNLSAVALNDMEMCFIPKRLLEKSINDNVEFTKAVMIKMAGDLKFADDVIVNMAQKTVKQRIAETLLYLENNFGLDNDGFIAITLSREDIASVVGAAKEACIRTLSNFKKESYIQTEGKKIALNKKSTLNKIAKGV